MAILTHGSLTMEVGSTSPRAIYNATMELLDPGRITAGTFAARPVQPTSKANRYYYATDTNALYYDTGTAWVQLNPAAGSVPPSPGVVYTDGVSLLTDTKFQYDSLNDGLVIGGIGNATVDVGGVLPVHFALRKEGAAAILLGGLETAGAGAWPTFYFASRRGTFASPTNLLAGDPMGGPQWVGYEDASATLAMAAGITVTTLTDFAGGIFDAEMVLGAKRVSINQDFKLGAFTENSLLVVGPGGLVIESNANLAYNPTTHTFLVYSNSNPNGAFPLISGYADTGADPGSIGVSGTSVVAGGIGVQGGCDSATGIGVLGSASAGTGIKGESGDGISGLFQSRVDGNLFPTVVIRQKGADAINLLELQADDESVVASIDPFGEMTVELLNVGAFSMSLSANATVGGTNTGDQVLTHQFGITVGDGVNVITAGLKGFWKIPGSGNITITGWEIVSTDPSVLSGSIVFDLWVDSYANYPPTVADTITAAAKPTCTTAIKAQFSALTGWTTVIAGGKYIGFNVDSITSFTRVMLTVFYTAAT